MILFFRILFPLFVAMLFSSNLYSLELPQNGRVLKVKKGETILSILRKHGWKQSELTKVVQHPKLRKRNVYQKEIYYLVKKPATLVLFEKHNDQAYLITKNDIKLENVDFVTKNKSVKGKVRGSLQASILKKVNSVDIAQKFMNAYLLDYSLRRDIQRNAPFELTFERKYIGNTFIKYGEVLSTSLLIRGRKTVERDFVFFKNGGGAFLTKNGKAKTKKFYAPVKYLHITSLFQPRRRHPITKRIIPHMGIDFELPTGAPVLASGYGKIVRFGKNRAAGRYVVIQHSNGYQTFYNHLSEIADIKKGQKVVAGEQIGKIGCSGYCTKPHLHFSIKKNGRYINPAKHIYTHPYTQKRVVQAYLSK